MYSTHHKPLSDFRILAAERVIDKVLFCVRKLLSVSWREGIDVPEPDNTQREEGCNSKMGGKLCCVTGIGQSVEGKRRNLNMPVTLAIFGWDIEDHGVLILLLSHLQLPRATVVRRIPMTAFS